MNANEILAKYMAEFMTEPTLKKWECPDFYRTSYGYSEKKIAKIAEKENARLRAEYDRAVAANAEFKACIEKILACPSKLAFFFASSTQDFIERTRGRRSEIGARIEAIRKTLDRDFTFIYQSQGDAEPHTYKYNVLQEASQFMWSCTKKEKNGGIYLTDRNRDTFRWGMFDAAFPTDEAKREFISMYTEYNKLRGVLSNMETPCGVFFRMVGNIGGHGGIVDSMVKVLEGMPEDVVFASDWGVGGYYNGVVSRGEKKASFKSFYAGGWNIQRLHIRFRVTLLKH